MASILCHDGVMELDPLIEELRRRLALAAEAGGEDARALAARLTASLDAAARLMLLDALAAAAAEITRELAPGSVDMRLRGRTPEFVVALPPLALGGSETGADGEPFRPGPEPAELAAGEDAAMTRINLRLPEQIKARIEQAADRDGLSTNAWIVRAATAAVHRGDRTSGPVGTPSRGGQHYRGWAR
jgi:hypothetical protein